MPTVLILLQLLPGLIDAGINVTNVINSATAVIKTAQSEGRDPNDAEWAMLDAQIQNLRDQLNS